MVVEPGALIGGFRVERTLGRGRAGVVYEATQLTLGRRVALRVLESTESGELDRVLHASASFEHPGIVPVYEVGEASTGRFIAMRLMRGTTLESLLQSGGLQPELALRLLEEVGRALDDVHAAGLAHGNVAPRNVFVDESDRALLADFGLTVGPASTPAADRSSFAAMSGACLSTFGVTLASKDGATTQDIIVEAAKLLGSRRIRYRRRRLLLFPAVAVTVSAILTGVVLTRSDKGTAVNRLQPAPPLVAGAQALGSLLAPGRARTVGCDGLAQNPNSPECSLLQMRMSESTLAVPGDGVVRRWAVRGASGRMRLQVIRPVAGGRFLRVYLSQIGRAHV